MNRRAAATRTTQPHDTERLKMQPGIVGNSIIKLNDEMKRGRSTPGKRKPPGAEDIGRGRKLFFKLGFSKKVLSMQNQKF
jgi:hypothetical protein